MPALGVPLDAWLLPQAASPAPHKWRPSRATARRMELMRTLARHQSRIVLTALDMLLASFTRRAGPRNQQVPRRERKNSG